MPLVRAPLAIKSGPSQIVGAAAVAIAAPLTSFGLVYWLSAGNAIIAIVTAIAFAALGVFCVAALVRPLQKIATGLEAAASLAGVKARARPAAPDAFAAMMSNIETVTHRLDAMRRRARRHPVTGLAARPEFIAAMCDDVERGRATSLLGLIRFANLDQIMAFDDKAGEAALRAFAARLKQTVDKSRIVGHVDRDCFAIWFRDAEDAEAAQAELRAISYVLAHELSQGELKITPDVQVGTAVYPLDSDDPPALLSRAFVSLARPQRTASGALAFFDNGPVGDVRRRFSLEQDLRHAARRGELTLHYQPLVDIQEARVIGAEALLRWRHPEYGMVSPAEFVPILEDAALVHDVGRWTLHRACKQLSDWRRAGVEDFKIAVNLSPVQLRDPSLPAAVARTAASHGIDPSLIELELTEMAAMENADGTRAAFRALKELGFGLAIDDFGSGYSSLAYLKDLPFSKLKIDRTFVTHVDTRADSRAICKALVELTKGLQLSVLAEGVERREEVEELRRIGCSVFQGFYFSPALPAGDFLAKITNTDWLSLARSPVHRERDELRRRLS